eukprot:TRINITY_DN32598_c0_g1_i1.p1 TRINITY_DN32598_c0_g1~~TRINITY_DN32598_c0_g1_i1.p1  ORF type:complete len:484 (+),score=92.09 TRINITY_DN32598_c0_g1_i1:32-1483(+)
MPPCPAMACGSVAIGQRLLAPKLVITCLCFLGSRCVARPWTFSGTYTIVNKASGRRIVSDDKGFYTVGGEPIYNAHMWRILAQANDSFALANAANGVRVYAQLGKDRENGFFVIDPDGPVYQDQRWHMVLQTDGSHALVNAKSGRRVVDGAGGFVAMAMSPDEPTAEDAKWWLINQGKVEMGPLLLELQSERHNRSLLADDAARCRQEMSEQQVQLQEAFSRANATASSLQALRADLLAQIEVSRKEVADARQELQSERAARSVLEVEAALASAKAEWRLLQLASVDLQELMRLRTLAVLVVAFLALVWAWRSVRRSSGGLGNDFGYHIARAEIDGETARLVRVQCPGVRHQDIKVTLIPNGCDVCVFRCASPGLEASTWQQRFCFDLTEGLFEFKEEQMQLEQGFLQLVFKEIHYRDRNIRFAQHYSLDAFDDSLSWEYPSAAVEDACHVQKAPTGLVDSASVAGSSQSTASSMLQAQPRAV